MVTSYRSIVLALLLCVGLAVTLYLRRKPESIPVQPKPRVKIKLLSSQTDQTPTIHFRYSIYILPVSKVDPLTVVSQELNHQEPQLVNALPKQANRSLVHAYVEEDLHGPSAPPSVESLRYFGRGLNTQQERAIQESRQLLHLEFAHPSSKVWDALRDANSITEAVARKTGGLIWDDETRELFTPEAWHEERLFASTRESPRIDKQIARHVYKDGELLRAITLGMAKVGLPDLVLASISESQRAQAANLLILLSQALAEGQSIPRNGEIRLELKSIRNEDLRNRQTKDLFQNAYGIGCLTLKPAQHDEGDPENRLLLLTADAYPGGDVTEQQESLISSFFGATDEISKIHHNEELLTESSRERAKLPALRDTFQAGLPPGAYLEVKAPFATSTGGREWMWVEVTRWRDDQVTGLLQNDPDDVPSLHSGQTVTVKQADLFDYLLFQPDGREEGNTTGPLIERMENSGKRVTVRIVPPPECASTPN